MEKLKTNLKDILLLIGFTIAFIISLSFIGSVKEAVINAVKSCVFSIVPSLFTVCVLCGWAAEYGVFERVFIKSRINPAILCSFILGNIGGYPIGAKILSDFVKKGRLTSNEANRAVCFSFSPGPAFCVGAVAPVVFHNSTLGWSVYLAILLANFTIFLFYRKCFSRNENRLVLSEASFTNCITSSVSSAAYSMISICSAILFFSAVSAVIREIIPSISDKSLIYALMEISAVTKAEYIDLPSFLVINAALAFGGLCVMMQIKSLVGRSYSLKLFLKSRLIQIGLSSLFGCVIYILAKRYIPAIAKEYTYAFTHSDSILPFICILGMIAISITYRKKQRRTR